MAEFVVALAALLAAASPPTSQADPGEGVFRTIGELRRAAGQFRLDGHDTDWKPFYRSVDTEGDAGGNAALDLVSAAIAPTGVDVWILLATAAAPSRNEFSYYIFLNLYGDGNSNVKIEVTGAGKPLSASRLDDGKPGPKVILPRARAAVNRVVEIRIPWSDLARVVPNDKVGLLMGSNARPWVRLECQTWDAQSRTVVDDGPSVASFRLVETPYPLDEPLPERPEPPVVIDLPTRGPWFVLQGSHGSYSHRGLWAVDLTKLDVTGHFSRPSSSTRLEDYFAWDADVYAPSSGLVLRACEDIDDRPPGESAEMGSPGNVVHLQHGFDYAIDLVHFRKDGVLVSFGDQVERGQKLGHVGNSGASDTPHLHVAVQRSRLFQTVPLAFRNVRVGLNLGADDPWARSIEAWEPRKGYFVEPLSNP